MSAQFRQNSNSACLAYKPGRRTDLLSAFEALVSAEFQNTKQLVLNYLVTYDV